MTDFEKLLCGSRLYTLHSHTQFCDGRNTVSQFAEAAAAAGFSHYGFTPHSPVPIASLCNMAMDQVPAYLEQVEAARCAHPSVHFLAGMEVDYLDNGWGPAHPYFRGLPLDYTIGSVHFLRADTGGHVDIDGSAERFAGYVHTHWNGDLRRVVELFYVTSIQMVRHGGFDIIGHMDKIGRNAAVVQPGIENEPWYADCVHALIEAIAESGVTMEVNTKAYDREGRIFPAPRWLRAALQAGIPVVVNSDAHQAALINAGRSYALQLVDSLR